MHRKFWLWGLVCTVALVGCDATSQKETASSPYEHGTEPWAAAADEACALAKKGEFKKASRLVNAALQSFSNESALHLLNGMIYEDMAKRGEEGTQELALVAYYRAISLDSCDWHAFYRAGCLRLKNKEYPQAQELFANALKLQPRSALLLYHLAVASYYAQDLESARVSMNEALACAKNPPAPFWRTAAIISAAIGDGDQARLYLDQLAASSETDHLADAKQRVARWNELHQKQMYQTAALSSDGFPSDAPDGSGAFGGGNASGTPPADSLNGGGPNGDDPNGDSSPAGPSRDAGTLSDAIVFDCYILIVNEGVSASKGINIFTNNVQNTTNLSNPWLSITPRGINYGAQSNGTLLAPYFNGAGTGLMSKQIAWSPIVYNLNIMNVNDNRVEILGRPTLSTFLGVNAQFASGNVFKAGITGSAGGTIVNIPTGILMSLKPIKVKGETVTVEVAIESTVTPDGAVNVEAAFSDQIVRFLTTKMETTLEIKFNETGIIGGDFQKIFTTSNDKFPVLGDIPVLQFFTSNENHQHVSSSSLFLITPRRPASMLAQTKTALSIKQQRKHLPTLQAWLKSRQRLQVKDTSLAHSLRMLAPSDTASYIRRGDVIPLNMEHVNSLREDILPWSSFFYYGSNL